MRRVLVTGCFDMLHAGHVATLQWARSQGDMLIVALNSDESVRRLKGEGHPVIPYLERSFLLSSLNCVNVVAMQEQDTPEKIINEWKPTTLVKGPEFAGREKEVPCGHLVGQVLIAPPLYPDHTTDILKRIRSLGG